MFATTAPPGSPYARRPGIVAHAFVAGREAAEAALASDACPYDRSDAPDEHGAWHRGFNLAAALHREG